ncbi:hypothetical protein VTK73DRAFT_10361 [Phialemonium thermophilum]|uniref:Dihydroorotate dehydrogenase catalytic domain-containing protein n=1 Tax=Phialemonium thermophilum TaxID=223376 RepID=A0ABR3XGZ5_9PEZI
MASSFLRMRRSFPSAFRPLKSASSPALLPKFGSRVVRRQASTSSSSSTDSLFVSRLRIFLFGSSVAASAWFVYLYATDTRASFHRWLVPPLLRAVFPDAEDAHHVGTAALSVLYSLNLHPRERTFTKSDPAADALAVQVFDDTLSNPIGISAGLDKDAEVPDALFALGAAVVEVGGCTPRPQAGNPRPRVFRVPVLDGIVNRYGLNSRGADAMAARLRERVRLFALRHGVSEREVLDGLVRVVKDGTATADVVNPGSLQPGKLLAVQVAKNKDTDEKDVNAVTSDYVYCVKRLAKYADVLVVNVSSPNTPGLRDLQATEPLTRILTAVVDEARAVDRRVPPKVMVKVSPDEDDDSQVEGVVQAVCMSGVDGIIVGNTTKKRTGLIPPSIRLSGKEQLALLEEGGFSGPATFDQTLKLVAKYRKTLDDQSLRSEPASGAKDDWAAGSRAQKIIFASGGITNGERALKVLNAGASLAMVYTGLVYGGSGTITRIKREMSEQLQSSRVKDVASP